jgi:hypothetical protein
VIGLVVVVLQGVGLLVVRLKGSGVTIFVGYSVGCSVAQCMVGLSVCVTGLSVG